MPAQRPGYRFLLAALLVLIFISYGAIGRDVLFNRISDPSAFDPIGAVLVYFRLLFAGLAVLAIMNAIGLEQLIDRVPRIMIPFVALAVASSVWADNHAATFRNAIVLCGLTVAVPSIISEIGLLRVARLTIAFTAVVLVASAALALAVPGVGRHMASDAMQTTHSGLWRGVFGHKNSLGPWAAYGSVLLITHRRMLRWPLSLWLVSTASAWSCLVFSGSMTSLVGASVMMGTLCLVQVRRYCTLPLFAVVSALAVVAGGLAAYVGQAIVFEALGRTTDFSGRIDVWPIAIETIAKSPWFGYGFQTSGGPAFSEVASARFGMFWDSAENAYLTELLELGAVGFALFFGPVLIALARTLSALGRLEGDQARAFTMMVMIIISTLVMAFTESTPFICTGFDGVISFTALFSLLAAPRELGRRRLLWKPVAPVAGRPTFRPLPARMRPYTVPHASR